VSRCKTALSDLLQSYTLHMPMWLSSDVQTRRAHDNPDIPSCAGRMHGQVLIVMPFSSGSSWKWWVCGEVQVPSAAMESPKKYVASNVGTWHSREIKCRTAAGNKFAWAGSRE
jgi:hypothetical protein